MPSTALSTRHKIVFEILTPFLLGWGCVSSMIQLEKLSPREAVRKSPKVRHTGGALRQSALSFRVSTAKAQQPLEGQGHRSHELKRGAWPEAGNQRCLGKHPDQFPEKGEEPDKSSSFHTLQFVSWDRS